MKNLFTTTILLYCICPSILLASNLEEAANVLGLKYPIRIDVSHMYSDGGTIGMMLTDSNNKELKLSYDGRKEKSSRLFGTKYHIYLGAFHPTHSDAIEVPICSLKEKSSYKIIKNWVENNYPKDWRDTSKYANTGYLKRLIDDLGSRDCD